jgi:hypothetical protein
MKNMYEEEKNINLKPEPQHLLQHEFSVIVFLDYLCERPFDLIYQDKIIQQYQSKILGELVSVRTEIRDLWVDLRIEDGISQIITKTEDVAKENGFTQSIRKQSMKYLLPIMIGFFALSIGVMFLVADPIISYAVFIPLLFVVCFLPRLINQRLLNRWQLLSTEKGPLMKKYIQDVIDRFHKFIQFLINDVRNILTENQMDLTNYRLMLFNTEYENIKVLQEEVRKGVKFYVIELLPLGTEAGSAGSTKKSDAVYDADFGHPEP